MPEEEMIKSGRGTTDWLERAGPGERGKDG